MSKTSVVHQKWVHVVYATDQADGAHVRRATRGRSGNLAHDVPFPGEPIVSALTSLASVAIYMAHGLRPHRAIP